MFEKYCQYGLHLETCKFDFTHESHETLDWPTRRAFDTIIMSSLQLGLREIQHNIFQRGCLPVKQWHIQGAQGAQRREPSLRDTSHVQAKEDLKSRCLLLCLNK